MKLLTIVPGAQLGRPGYAALIVDLEGAKYYQAIPGLPAELRGASLFVVELEKPPDTRLPAHEQALESIRATIAAAKASLTEWERLEAQLVCGEVSGTSFPLPGANGAKA